MKILIGGSPCTHWSIAQTKNRETEASGIGWELFLNYRIARDKFKPDFFLYENNKSMSPAIRAQITKELGVEPILINSALVSAQKRQRLYWVGKQNQDGTYSQVDVAQPEDRGIILRDVLESGVCWREKGYALLGEVAATAEDMIRRHQRNGVAEAVNITADGKAQCLRATYYKDGIRNLVANTVDRKTCVAEPVRIGTIESGTGTTHDSKPFRVYSPDGESVTIQGEAGGIGAKTGLYAVPLEVEEPIDRVFCINGLGGGKARTVDAHMGKLENNLVPRINNPNPAKQQYDCIVEPVRVGTMPTKDGEVKNHQSSRVYAVDGKSVPILARPNGGGADGATTGLYATPVCVGHRPKQNGDLVDHQSTRIYAVDGKGTTLAAKSNGGGCDGSTTGWYAVPAGMARRGRDDSSAFEMRDDQKANAVIVGHQSRLVIEAADGKTYPVYEVRAGLITIKDRQYPIKLADGYYIIRKLTVRECMRLQTVPEDYIFPVSDTQAYKMLGNGWTVDVIAHILSHIPGITTEPVAVLSMYDGMSCGHIALDKLGACVSAYYATEIDKYAIKTTLENYPDTIQLGDAFQVREDGCCLEHSERSESA